MKLDESQKFVLWLYFIVNLVKILSLQSSYDCFIQPVLGILIISIDLILNRLYNNTKNIIDNRVIKLLIFSLLSF
jgi:hypothetical protein